MTGRWNKHKTKKPLETSLGQAPKETEKGVDQSHLRKPITTSIFGLKQVLSLFQTATNEVQQYITYECDVLYECRICRTIFRSLANFILHKRSYCREKYHNLGGANHESAGGFVVGQDEGKAVPVSDEEVKSCSIPEQNEEKKEQSQSEDLEKSASSSPKAEPNGGDFSKKNDKKTVLLPIIDKLIKKQEINILAKNTLNEDLSTKADNSDDDVVFVSEENNVMLQKIDTSNVAVFQTTVQDPLDTSKIISGLMKSEVMEIHGILENNEAVLGSNGKVCNFETNKKIFKPNIPKQELVCTECNFTFSTEKTLTHHIKYKHNKTCIVYPCPDCKETFANAWSVYRHLYKVHRRTSSQVRRMRAQIHSSGIRKDQEPEKKKDNKNIAALRKENEENQWMNNFERDKDLQMCGGCGKRFERKAALHSHSQMCTKRIAICNTIKENDLKMKMAENKSKTTSEKTAKTNGTKAAKGSAKRKPNAMFVHKIAPSVAENEEKTESGNGEDGCDNLVAEECKKVEQNGDGGEGGTAGTGSTATVESGSSIIARDVDLSSASLLKIRKKNNERKRRIEAIRRTNQAVVLTKLPHVSTNAIKVSEVISDSDEEKENSLAIAEDKEIGGDVVITKYKDSHEEEEEKEKTQNDPLPEIEIFTISDDSCDIDKVEDGTTTSTTANEQVEISLEQQPLSQKDEEVEIEEEGTIGKKRKRSDSWDLDDKLVSVGYEYREYLNDELDQCFFAKAVTYMDKTVLKCIPCKTKYLSQYQLLQHMSLHFSWFRFQCSKCSFMSFYKYDCTTHAYASHGTPNNLIGSTVLPIPKWKVLCGAHNFADLNEEVANNNTTTVEPVSTEDCGKTMPQLEAITRLEVDETKDGVVTVNGHHDKNNVSEDGAVHTSSEIVVVEDDEMPDICNDNANGGEAAVSSDEEMKEQMMKEIKAKAGPSTVRESVANNRPVRNRTKSVKTVQNDFIYDLAKVLKLNDNSMKSSKLKKSLGKS